RNIYVDQLRVHVGVFFFFFQAEDGIRDLTVTGVQTCALPISLAHAARQALERCVRKSGYAKKRKEYDRWNKNAKNPVWRGIGLRSEERRVGKECRSWWWTEQ